MLLIIKFGLTKVGISSTLHAAVRYVPQSLLGIRIFYPFVIQGSGLIAFLVNNYWKLDTYIQLLWSNLSTLHIETGREGHIL